MQPIVEIRFWLTTALCLAIVVVLAPTKGVKNRWLLLGFVFMSWGLYAAYYIPSALSRAGELTANQYREIMSSAATPLALLGVTSWVLLLLYALKVRTSSREREQNESDQQQAKAAPSKRSGGMIPEGFYPWWVGGVLVGGVVVSIATSMAVEDIAPEVAWIGGMASALAFLFCLDTRGSFRLATAVPAIAVLAIGANVYHQNTGRPVAALGGILGFIVYALFGFLGVGLGKLVRRRG